MIYVKEASISGSLLMIYAAGFELSGPVNARTGKKIIHKKISPKVIPAP